jgi:hypothetical protein
MVRSPPRRKPGLPRRGAIAQLCCPAVMRGRDVNDPHPA